MAPGEGGIDLFVEPPRQARITIPQSPAVRNSRGDAALAADIPKRPPVRLWKKGGNRADAEVIPGVLSRMASQLSAEPLAFLLMPAVHQRRCRPST
jgi:hypothetical protein